MSPFHDEDALVKEIARHFDAKLNDVVLALCAGALRKQFAPLLKPHSVALVLTTP